MDSARPLRLLAAEDNRTNQLVFRKMLAALDLELTMVENGQLALELCIDDRPDMLFTDISMPVMDGLEAVRRLRAHEEANGLPRLPVVAMTAHAVDGDESRIRDAGVDHYMTKPYRKDAICAMIRQLAPGGTDP